MTQRSVHTALASLCPMLVHLDGDGRVVASGPTFSKLVGPPGPIGRRFSDLVEIYRPAEIMRFPDLLTHAGRKLQMRLADHPHTPLKGMCMPDGDGGAYVNMSFGLGVPDAVRLHKLTSTDFAVTDLAIDMLYLIEAKSAAMEASRTLNKRLQGAMLQAEQRAYTDTLTGLPNRRAMNNMLTRLTRNGTRFALMHLDLDFFKEVNDTYGHAAGDKVLQTAADAMLTITRKDDLVARIGGDEFVIICSGVQDRSQLGDLAARLIRRIEEPIPLVGGLANVSASIGIALSGPKCEGIGKAETILDCADIALYRAKRAGRAQFAFYDPEPAVAAGR